MTERDKQIAEMAKLACSVFDGNCMGCSFAICPPCPPKASAERLYNAGYRKQVEGEWDDSVVGFCNVCMSCRAIVERAAIKNNSGKLNFCPNCGAKMKVGESDDR